jgi:hypothetical protein
MSRPVSATVPDELIGCWRRDWIRFADGALDDTTGVYWLQHESEMVDVRIPVTQPDARGRVGFDAFELGELVQLADSESSSGCTVCTSVAAGDDGIRRAIAVWFTRDQLHDRTGVAFQPVTAYPEPGLLEWNDDGSVMIERAPSGAYVEQWRLVPGSRAERETRTNPDGARWFRTGDVAAIVRDRSIAVPRPARLQELIAELDHDRDRIAALLDCEFSVARRHPDSTWRIVISTLPWKKGSHVDPPR